MVTESAHLSRQLTIGKTVVSDDSGAYVVAEVGQNHQGSVEICRQIFEEARRCGANAVKLQKRDNGTLFTRAMYDSPYTGDGSHGATYGAHREALEFGEAEYVDLQAHATALGLDFLATPFDFASVDLLMKLDVPALKVASGDLTNTPLLEYIAQCGKPIILSTGGGSMEDVRRAYATIAVHTTKCALLQCTLIYPTPTRHMNLRVIETYRQEFPANVIGLSDHHRGGTLAAAAYALGARIFEKHFTLNRGWSGTDHKLSLEPAGLRRFVTALERTRVALGTGRKAVLAGELKALRKLGKKIVAARALPRGHILTREDIALKSPGDGLAPFHLSMVVGRATTRALAEDDDIRLEDLRPHTAPRGGAEAR